MSKISTIRFYIILSCMTLLLLHRAASGCQVDEFYLTNEGHLAGSTQDNLTEAITYQGKNDQQHLAIMIRNGEAIRLKDNVKVQALERSFEQQMIKIKFPDSETPLWVREDSLKRINCD
jgi:hypothetical protein